MEVVIIYGDPDIVRRMLAELEMSTPVSHRPGLVLDTTHLDPKETAGEIARYLDIPTRRDS